MTCGHAESQTAAHPSAQRQGTGTWLQIGGDGAWLTHGPAHGTSGVGHVLRTVVGHAGGITTIGSPHVRSGQAIGSRTRRTSESLELTPLRFVAVSVNVTSCSQSHADGAVYVVLG